MHAGSIILLLAAAWTLQKTQESPYFWILAWPGTALHECLHWSVGLLLNARPVDIQFLPDKQTQVLGSVTFANIRWYNAVPVGLAPLLAVPLTIGLVKTAPWSWTWAGVLYFWAAASALSQAWPSRADFDIAGTYWTGIASWGLGAGFLLRHFLTI